MDPAQYPGAQLPGTCHRPPAQGSGSRLSKRCLGSSCTKPFAQPLKPLLADALRTDQEPNSRSDRTSHRGLTSGVSSNGYDELILGQLGLVDPSAAHPAEDGRTVVDLHNGPGPDALDRVAGESQGLDRGQVRYPAFCDGERA